MLNKKASTPLISDRQESRARTLSVRGRDYQSTKGSSHASLGQALYLIASQCVLIISYLQRVCSVYQGPLEPQRLLQLPLVTGDVKGTLARVVCMLQSVSNEWVRHPPPSQGKNLIFISGFEGGESQISEDRLERKFLPFQGAGPEKLYLSIPDGIAPKTLSENKFTGLRR